MTEVGKLVLSIYSLVAVMVLTILGIRKTAREEENGWELILLIPTLIFLVNMI